MTSWVVLSDGTLIPSFGAAQQERREETMIHTKLHIVQQIVSGQNTDAVVLEAHGANVDSAMRAVAAMVAAPKYCIDRQVIELLRREDANKSVLAIMAAGIARLPFNPMLVEYTAPPLEGAPIHEPSRYFVLLTEIGPDEIGARVARLSHNDDSLVVQPGATSIGLSPEGFLVSGINWEDRTGDTMAVAATVGLAVAILMLNTKGLEKEVIHTDRINKARARRPDRAPIPQHTIVRIGTIYDRSGKAHSAIGTGRHMPVHLRAGHTRHQHHGKGNEEVKIIYIPPCIVNYRDSDGEKPRLPDKTIII